MLVFQEETMLSVKLVKDVYDLKKSKYYTEYSDSMKVALFERFFELA